MGLAVEVSLELLKKSRVCLLSLLLGSPIDRRKGKTENNKKIHCCAMSSDLLLAMDFKKLVSYPSINLASLCRKMSNDHADS